MGVSVQSEGVGRTEQAVGAEAAVGSAGRAPAGDGCGALQPALDPVHPAAQAFPQVLQELLQPSEEFHQLLQ